MNGQRLVMLGIAMAVLVCVSPAHAAMIPSAIVGVTGEAFAQGDNAVPGDGSWIKVLDGSGLTVGDPNDSSTWTHDANWRNNWQGGGSFTDGNTPGAWFSADLGAIYTDLDELHIWNVVEGTATNRGIKDIDILYSTSPSAPWDWTLLGSYVVPEGTDGGGTPADMVIDLSSIPSADHIGIEINTNHGSTFRVGFAEMQFTRVPEPSTVLLSGLALAAVGMLIRKRR